MIDTEQTPSRILMTTDTVGGVWTYALELLRALEPHGVSVVLATMGAPLRDDQRAQVEAFGHVQVEESTFDLEWMQEPWEDVAAAGAWLLELADRTGVELVHLNGFAHGSLPWQVPVLVVGHSCVTSWHAAVKGRAPSASWDRYRREVAAGLRGADLVTAPTRAMLEALEHHYGTFTAAPAVHNGRRAADFLPAAPEPFVLTAGRLWDEAKNTAALAAAAPGLPWPVYVAGEVRNPSDGGVVSFDNVEALGRLRPDVLAGWMGRASIYVLPARYEPFGLTAVEAALAGCALVLGDIPTLREVWGEAALFVPPDDHDALGTAIRRLIDDEPLRREMTRRARRRALHYTPERMARGYLDLYRRLRAAPAPVTAPPRVHTWRWAV